MFVQDCCRIKVSLFLCHLCSCVHIAWSQCNKDLGLQSFWTPNSDVTASSILDSFHDPGQARLHGKGAWMPLVQDSEQFLQIDFKGEVDLSAVAVQGHPKYEYWVMKFALSFSLDGKAWDELHEVK